MAADAYDVRVELGVPSDVDVIRADLEAHVASDLAGWLLEVGPCVATTDTRTEVRLTVPGPDVWTAALTTMAALHRLDHDVRGLHVESGPTSS